MIRKAILSWVSWWSSPSVFLCCGIFGAAGGGTPLKLCINCFSSVNFIAPLCVLTYQSKNWKTNKRNGYCLIVPSVSTIMTAGISLIWKFFITFFSLCGTNPNLNLVLISPVVQKSVSKNIEYWIPRESALNIGDEVSFALNSSTFGSVWSWKNGSCVPK